MGQTPSVEIIGKPLQLASKGLTEFPKESLNTVQQDIDSIDLIDNKLEDLPPLNTIFPLLKSLRISKNSFKYLPPTLGNLDELEQLVCYFFF